MQSQLTKPRPSPGLKDVAQRVFINDATTGDQVWEDLARLQREAPLYFFEEGNFWVATGYTEARTVLGAPGSTLAFEERNDRVSTTWRAHSGINRIADWYAHKVGADYSRIRRVAFGFFTPMAARSFSSFLEQAAREVVAAFKRDGGGNVYEGLGYRLTTKITDHLLGLNEDNRPNFRDLIGRAMQSFKINLTDEEWREGDAASDEMRAFWAERIRERMANPLGDDVIARVIRGGELSEQEIIVLAENILLAGSDTTANTVANGIGLLLRNPQEMMRAQRDQRLRDVVPDEILRLVSPGPSTWRGLVADLDVNGTTIPAHSLAMVVHGAANRDPAVFSSGHAFNLDWYFEDRPKDRRGIPFGLGQHMCLGQYFVRAALGALFNELLAEGNTIELDGELPELCSLGLRQQVSQLKVRFR